MLAIKQAFLRRVDELQVVSPQRSAGRQRRYTRHEIRIIQHVVTMADEGITLQAIRRIIELEQLLAEVTRERDELARRLAERQPQRPPAQSRTPVSSSSNRRGNEFAPAGCASASRSSTGRASASAARWSGVSSSRLAVSIKVVSARMRWSASCPCGVMVRVLARASLGSAQPAHVAAVLQRGHQPGKCRRGDALGRGQVAEPHRPGLPDRGQRGELGGCQARQLVAAQPAGQPRQGDAQPGNVDVRIARGLPVGSERQPRPVGYRFRAHPSRLTRCAQYTGARSRRAVAAPRRLDAATGDRDR